MAGSRKKIHGKTIVSVILPYSIYCVYAFLTASGGGKLTNTFALEILPDSNGP
jgi:hypothetical protein